MATPDPLLTPARYAAITSDATSTGTTLTDAIAEATALLEETLSRKLPQQSVTERLIPDGEGRLYPTVTPIISAPGLTAWGDIIVGGPFFTGPGFIVYDARIQITYTGGFLERTANPAASNRLPAHVERDLAWATWIILHPANLVAAVSSPAGATSVRVGDAGVGYGASGAPAPGMTVERIWSSGTRRLSRVGKRL